MTPIKQRIVDKGYGDCMKATVASLLELPYDAVPHFLACGNKWHRVLIKFFEAYGYNWSGSGYPQNGKRLPEFCIPRENESINGFFYASVPSKNFRNTSHAVVMDMNGFCAHDPSPLGLYQDQQILKNKIVNYWMTFQKAR